MRVGARILTGIMAAALPLSVAAISFEEGIRLKAYQDAGGVWTICHGWTQGVRPGDVATLPECREKTLSGTLYYQDVVNASLKAAPSPARLTGLTDFAYNVGTGAFLKSSLLKRLNALDPHACDQLRRWVYVAGRDCRREKGLRNGCYGIVERRERERLACLGTLPPEWQR